ncbi:MAG: hypothetical protein V4667_11650 [Bacteroidota bacterium]
MKKIKFVVLALAATIMFACGGGKKEGSVVGNWKLKKTEGYEVGTLGETTLNFEEPSTYKWKTGIVESIGDYKISNDTLTMTDKNNPTYPTKYTFKFQEGQLLMTLVTTPKYQVTYFFE